MSQPVYRVVFVEIEDKDKYAKNIDRLASIFHTNKDKIEKLFVNENQVIKNGLSLGNALKLNELFRKYGINTRTDPEAEINVSSNEEKSLKNESEIFQREDLIKNFPPNLPSSIYKKFNLSWYSFTILLGIFLMIFSVISHQFSYYRITSSVIKKWKKNKVNPHIIEIIEKKYNRQYKDDKDMIADLEKFNNKKFTPFQRLWLYQYAHYGAVFRMTNALFEEFIEKVDVQNHENIVEFLGSEYSDEEDFINSLKTIFGIGGIVTYRALASKIAYKYATYKINNKLISQLKYGPDFGNIIKRTKWIRGETYLISEDFIDSLRPVLGTLLTKEEEKKILKHSIMFSDLSNWKIKETLFQATQMPILIVYIIIFWPMFRNLFAGVLLSYRSMLSMNHQKFNEMIHNLMTPNYNREALIFMMGALIGYLIFQPWRYGFSLITIYLFLVEGLLFGFALWYIFKLSSCLILLRTINHMPLTLNIFKPLALESVAQWSFGITLFVIGLVTLSSWTTINSDNRYHILYTFLLWGNIFVFYLSMWGTHRAMKKAKNNELKDIGEQLEIVYIEMKKRIHKNELDVVDKLTNVVNNILAYERRIKEAPVWPHNFSTVRKVIASILLPIIISYKDKIASTLEDLALFFEII
jgi:hypothetical protein